MTLLTLPNFISLMRIPLALVFLQADIFYRCVALILAMLSDGLDGYLARRYRLSSRIGTTLDPVTDKFFVFFILFMFMEEGRLGWWELGAMICRDFSLFLFGFYLVFMKKWEKYQFRAIWCGKITTFLQFTVLIALTLGFQIPSYLYVSFLILGLLALVELYFCRHQKVSTLERTT